MKTKIDINLNRKSEIKSRLSFLSITWVLEKVMFRFELRNILKMFVWNDPLNVGIRTLFEHLLLQIITKQQSSLYHLLSWSGTRSSWWWSFSVESPLMVPVIAMEALYWNNSNFWWKAKLNAWSYMISPWSR